MKKKTDRKSRPRSIVSHYYLQYYYEHFLAANAFMESKGHNLALILKTNHSPGRFSKWKNRLDPFAMDKLTNALEQYDFRWSDVQFRDVKLIKQRSLARTVEHFGKASGGINGNFPEIGGLDVMVAYFKSATRIRGQFLNRAVSREQVRTAIYHDVVNTCHSASKFELDDLFEFVDIWYGCYRDAIDALRESFTEIALDLDQCSSKDP